MAFRLFGGLSITVDGCVRQAPPVRTRGLLAILLLEPRAHPRVRLAEQLRPDLSPSHARHRLSSLLWLLRSTVPELPLETDATTVQLPQPARWVDVEAFREDLASDDDARRRAGLKVYRDRLLPEVELEWVTWRRDALHSEYLAGAHQLAADRWADGAPDEALAILQRLCEHDEIDEESLRLLMRVASGAGRTQAGTIAFRRHLRRLTALGLDPEEETVALAKRTGAEAEDGQPSRADSRSTPATASGRTSMPGVRQPAGCRRMGEAERALRAGDVPAAARVLEELTSPEARLWHARLSRREGRADLATSSLVQARAASDRPAIVSAAMAEEARVATLRGEGRRALMLAGESALLAVDHDLPVEHAAAALATGQEHHRCGREAQAVMAVRPLLDLDLPVAMVLEARCLLAMAQVGRGQLGTAMVMTTQTTAQARSAGHADLLSECLVAEAFVRRRAGDHGGARAALSDARGAGVTGQRTLASRDAALALEQVALALDAHDEPVTERLMILDPALRHQCGQNPALAGPLLALQGLLHQRAGRHGDACAALRAAGRAHAERDERHLVATTRAAAVSSLLELGMVDDARDAIRTALAVRDKGLLPTDLEPQVLLAQAAVECPAGRLTGPNADRALARLDAIGATAGDGGVGVRRRDATARALNARRPVSTGSLHLQKQAS